MPKKRLMTPGDRYGDLVLVHELPKLGDDRVGLFRCDCGTEKAVRFASVWRGTTIACGQVHGDAKRGQSTAEYRSWQNMIRRCGDPTNKRFKWYGARGIKVCDRWLHDYAAFLLDMGRKPTPKHTLDRINNSGNYEPSNCRWATMAEQSQNRRSTQINLEAAKVIRFHAKRKWGNGRLLARIYGVSTGIVSAIARGRTWKEAANAS